MDKPCGLDSPGRHLVLGTVDGGGGDNDDFIVGRGQKVKKYEIYLTKSRQVADLLWQAQTKNMEGKGGWAAGSRAALKGDDMIPEIFCGCGYYYCYVVYESDQPGYELIFA